MVTYSGEVESKCYLLLKHGMFTSLVYFNQLSRLQAETAQEPRGSFLIIN